MSSTRPRAAAGPRRGPGWLDPVVRDRLVAAGHRLALGPPGRRCGARAGRSVIVNTGAASGKALAYLLPALTAVRAGAGRGRRRQAVLYMAPTKATALEPREAPL